MINKYFTVKKKRNVAIRFYQKCGFVPTGEELFSPNISAAEIRMLLKRSPAV